MTKQAKPVTQARVKQPNEAEPPRSNYKGSIYRIGDGDQFAPARPGSMDFLKYKSKGYRT